MKKDYMKVYKRREKIHDIKEKVTDKICNGVQWVINNKDLVIIFAPVVISGVTTVVKVVGKQINLRKQETIKNLYCYDRSAGHYWKLRRELSTDEWIQIDRRKQNGERLSDILDDLRVLK